MVVEAWVSAIGIVALLVLSVLGKSAVMAVSAVGIGVALVIARSATFRRRSAALVLGALGGSLLAETVHTAYHLLGGETASGDSGFFFVSAILVGGINAIAMLVLTGVAHALFRGGDVVDDEAEVDP